MTHDVAPRVHRRDADECVCHYNSERPHSGKYCYGKTPTETFQESKHLAKEKELDNEKMAVARSDKSYSHHY